ncbi:MAG: hypothetical protein HY784_14140 [Chloroflexi bacterium]|nr:hypothetical protein [Chloroflexota bacterium]
MKKRKQKLPTLGGVPVVPIMEVHHGEAVAGTWVSNTVPGVGFYKLLAKRKTDGTCEWVSFTQRANGSKDSFYRGTVEDKARLQEVVEVHNSALHSAYGHSVSLHPADADMYPVDGAVVGQAPGKVQ